MEEEVEEERTPVAGWMCATITWSCWIVYPHTDREGMMPPYCLPLKSFLLSLTHIFSFSQYINISEQNGEERDIKREKYFVLSTVSVSWLTII